MQRDGTKAENTLRSMLDGKAHDGFEQLLPKLGLSYRLGSKGSNVYATLSKGYRAGGYNIQMFSDILQTELNANRQQAMRGSYDVPHTPEDYDNVNHTIAYKPRPRGTMRRERISTSWTDSCMWM